MASTLVLSATFARTDDLRFRGVTYGVGVYTAEVSTVIGDRDEKFVRLVVYGYERRETGTGFVRRVCNMFEFAEDNEKKELKRAKAFARSIAKGSTPATDPR